MGLDYDAIIDAIKDSDALSVCAMFWDSESVWSRGDHGDQNVVKEWSKATIDDAAAWLEQSDAWRSVAGKQNISTVECDAIVDSAIYACWWSMVESALDRLREKRKEVESDIYDLEAVMYFQCYGQQNKW